MPIITAPREASEVADRDEPVAPELTGSIGSAARHSCARTGQATAPVASARRWPDRQIAPLHQRGHERAGAERQQHRAEVIDLVAARLDARADRGAT